MYNPDYFMAASSFPMKLVDFKWERVQLFYPYRIEVARANTTLLSGCSVTVIIVDFSCDVKKAPAKVDCTKKVQRLNIRSLIGGLQFSYKELHDFVQKLCTRINQSVNQGTNKTPLFAHKDRESLRSPFKVLYEV